MVPDLKSKLTTGAVVSFRHFSPTANDKTPTVFVIAPEFEGALHGLNVRYMKPEHTAQLYWLFRTPEQRNKYQNPYVLEAQQNQRDFLVQQNKANLQQQVVEQRRQEYLEAQKGVIVKPNPGNPFGVSTFKKTQTQQPQPAIKTKTQATQFDPKQTLVKLPLMQQQNIDQQYENQLKMYMDSLVQSGRQIGDPMDFYYNYIKPIFGNNKAISFCYRKYKWEYIRNIRIVKSVHRLYGPSR